MTIKFHKPTKAEIDFWIEDTQIIRQRVYVGAYLLIIGVLLIGAFFGRKTAPIYVKDSKLHQAMSVGSGNNSMSVEVDKVQYNPTKNIMSLQLAGSNSDSLVLTGSEIKVFGNLVSGSARITTIPTTNNHWTVLVTDMPAQWGAVQLKIKSNMPVDPTVASDTSTDTSAAFNVTQTNAHVDKDLKLLDVKSVTQAAVETQIANKKQSIKSTKAQIQKVNAVIKYDGQQIDKLNKNMDVMTYAERADAKDSITQYTQDIDNQNATLDTLNKSVANKKKSLAQLQDKLESVSDGSYKFVTPKSTGVLKQKKQ